MNKLTSLIKKVLVLGAVLTACHLTAGNAQAATETKLKPVGKQNAEQLIEDAEKALAYTVKSARAGGKELDPKNPDAKPFYGSLKKINTALDKAKKALAAKDKSFFLAINEANRGVDEMQVTWELTHSKNAAVINGGKDLGGAISALQDNYNPLAERKAKGGELTADEKKDFDELKAKEKQLLKQIHELAAEEKKDVALEDGLKKIRQEARRIEKAPENVKSYADAVNSLSSLQGRIDGYTYFFTPAERSKWTAIQTESNSFTTDYSYSDYSYNWSDTSSSVDVYDTYDESVSEQEESSEDSFLEESSFDLNESEENEVAEDGDSMTEDDSSEMESDQEMEDDASDDSEMDSGGDDGGGDDSE